MDEIIQMMLVLIAATVVGVYVWTLLPSISG